MAESKGKVLVVDDDASILEVIKIILESNDINVVINSEPAETIRKIVAEKPDLLLMDVWMSGVDGLDIARTLKGDQNFSSLPIILISAKQDWDGSRSKLADDYIEKPFDMDDLVTRVKRFLNKV